LLVEHSNMLSLGWNVITRAAPSWWHVNLGTTYLNVPLATVSFISWQLSHVSTIEKKLVKQQYLQHMPSQYSELRPTNGQHRLAGLGHPSIFQGGLRLGFVTARHPSSGHQPNCAALNRGCHLYSAWRPSRWALAHITSLLCTALTVHIARKCLWFTWWWKLTNDALGWLYENSACYTPFTRYNWLSHRLYNPSDNRLDVCIHDATCCPTGCQIGLTTVLTTGCILKNVTKWWVSE